MRTLKLRVDDKIYDKVLWLLSKFSKDEIEIIAEAPDFARDQKYLEGELSEIINGEARFMGVEEAEKRLDQIIDHHENSI